MLWRAEESFAKRRPEGVERKHAVPPGMDGRPLCRALAFGLSSSPHLDTGLDLQVQSLAYSVVFLLKAGHLGA